MHSERHALLETYSKSICLGLMSLRRYVGSRDEPLRRGVACVGNMFRVTNVQVASRNQVLIKMLTYDGNATTPTRVVTNGAQTAG